VDPLQTIINAMVVGAVGLVLGWMVRGTRSELKAEIAEFRSEVRADISEFRA
jgi:hypothetical protein